MSINKPSNIGYEPTIMALNNILDDAQGDPVKMELAFSIAKIAFDEKSDSIPFSMYRTGLRLIEHAIEEVKEDGEYLDLFKKFANEPAILAKILTQKDPEKFFDLFLVTWRLKTFLAEFVELDPENKPLDLLENSGGDNLSYKENPLSPSDEILEKIKENIEYLDFEDILEMAIPLFKQSAHSGEDGFTRGYNKLLELVGEIDDQYSDKLQQVYDYLDELIEMKFAPFRPSLNKKNFPYLTVRRAIKTMEKKETESGSSRRFAYFDTRTGKTSLALLEPAYLNKQRSIYLCPPDTIPTIKREYETYQGNPEELFVARTTDQLNEFLENPNGFKYCIVPTSIIALTSKNEIDSAQEIDLDDIEAELLSELMCEDSENTTEEKPVDINQFKNRVNSSVLRLFNEWKPDYVAVDEARHFCGFNPYSPEKSSKRSMALMYLLNRKESVSADMSVRMMDATPGDKPEHFHSLLSYMNPAHFPSPQKVRMEIGRQPYLLSAHFSECVDRASHHQVYNRPPVKEVEAKEVGSVDMKPAQSVLYKWASKYSTNKVLERIMLARLATFNPVLLRKAMQKNLKRAMRIDSFQKNLKNTYSLFEKRNKEEGIEWGWDFLAQHADRKFFYQLFAFGPDHFMEKLKGPDADWQYDTLDQLKASDETLSCKFDHIINLLKQLSEGKMIENRSFDKVIVYSSFKRGLTRELTGGDLTDIDLEMEQSLINQIQKALPDLNLYTLDGQVSTRAQANTHSPRDQVRRAWKTEEGINVLLAVGAATSQGIDLTVGRKNILEIHIDEHMDSRMNYQIQSRTLGPQQKHMVVRLPLRAYVNGKPTIDAGITKLVDAKSHFSDLVCKGSNVPPAFMEAIENNDAFLGEYCETEDTEAEVVENTRKKIKKT